MNAGGRGAEGDDAAADSAAGAGAGAGGVQLKDRNIARLTAEAGSESAISRGKLLAGGIVVVGMLGALGAAMRPVWAARWAARQAARPGAGTAAGRSGVGATTARASSSSSSTSSSFSSATVAGSFAEYALNAPAGSNSAARGPGGVATRSAEEARRAIAAARGEALPPDEQARLDALLSRLSVLEAAHRQRHPMWYGQLPPDAAPIGASAASEAGAVDGTTQSPHR